MPLFALPSRAASPVGEVYTASGAPVLQDDERVELAMAGVHLNVEGAECGSGALYVTTQRVFWVCEAADRPGAEVDYPAVLMHATSRDGSADPAGARPAVFCQVEADPAWGAAAAAAGAASAGASGGDDGSADRDAGAADVVTMLLMPSAAATVLSSAGGRSAADAFGAGAAGGEAPEDALELVFRAMSCCSEMHPGDLTGADDDAGDAVTAGEAGGDNGAFMTLGGLPEGGMDGWITSPEQAAALDEAQLATLAALEGKLVARADGPALGACDDEDDDIE